MTAFRNAKTYDIAELRAHIPGRPVYRVVVDEIDPHTRLCADWSCGCVASGERFATLTLTACDEHRAPAD